MVRSLIALRSTIARNQLRGSSSAPLLAALVFGLLSAAGTVVLGTAHRSSPTAAGDVLAAVFALWLGGQVAQRAVTGDTTLRPELFALLPLDVRQLARALLVVGVADPALVVVALAYAALLPAAWGYGVAALTVAVIAVALEVVLTSVLATIAGGALGPGARRSRDLGTIVTSLAISVLAVSGTLLPGVLAALADGSAGWLSVTVRVLPSGWAADAVVAADQGHWARAALPLAALVLAAGAAALGWPTLLRRRMARTSRPAHVRSTSVLDRMLPASPLGGVVGKEVRTTLRDPSRVTCLLLSLVVGIGVAVVPRVTAGTGLLMPFAGTLTVLIAGACATVLAATDGTAFWLIVAAPRSAAAGLRGSLVAWLLVVGPWSVAETVVLTALSGHAELWPWAVALFVAVLGGSLAVAALGSVVAVYPLDASGNPTPAWSLKVHVALMAIAVAATPTVLALVLTTGTTRWTATIVAVVETGLIVPLALRAATRRLARCQVDILRRLAPAT